MKPWREKFVPWAWVPIPVLAVAIGALRLMRPQLSFESPFLVLVLNFVFSTIASFLIAYLIGRSFLASGSPGVLLLGCGVLAWGAAGVVANSVSQGNPNLDVTIHNLSVMLSAVLHLSGAIILASQKSIVRAGASWLSTAYVSTLGAVGLIVLMTTHGYTPTFFVPGEGGTSLRDFVLGSSIGMFLVTAILSSTNGKAANFSYWYALALFAISVGLLGIMLQSTIGELLAWAGRIALWLGGVYLLLAAFASVHESRVWGLPLEEALRISEARLSSILASMTDAFYSLDQNLRFTFVNDEMVRRLGRSHQQIVGKDMRTVMGEAADSLTYAQLHRAIAERIAIEYEVFHESQQCWFSEKAYPTDDGGLAVYSRDVTERKRTEAQLQKNQKTFIDLIERAPFGIYIVDSSFRISHMNAGSKAGPFRNVPNVIGFDFAESMRIIWPADVASYVIATFRHTLDTGEPFYSKDYVHPRADVEVVESYEWELHRIALPDGQHGVVCYFFDSTKLRQAEQALQEADRRKDTFLATLAHELRNPLAPIMNSLALLKHGAGNVDSSNQAHATIERQMKHMIRLVDELLDVSRITRNKLDLKKERLELASVIHHAVETCQPLCDQARHNLSISLPREPIYLNADAVRLAQIFANLLTNSCKYTEPAGNIWLTAERQGSEVVVVVRDNGIGIPKEMLSKVFDMFAQVDHSLERTHGGLGIGLSLVKLLVEKHEGTVTAHSGGVGQGSEFVIRLPVLLEKSVTALSAEPIGDVVPITARRILVIDDNHDSALTLAMLLKVSGNEMHIGHDGEEAVQKARKLNPDVILLDIGLPKLNGYEACRRIREQPWSQRMIMIALTGWGQEDDRRRSKEAGFDGHLVKPVDHNVLMKMLEELSRKTMNQTV